MHRLRLRPDFTSCRLILGLRTSHSASNDGLKPHEKLDLSFTDSKEAFKSKTNGQLLRALLVYKICSYETLVCNNRRLMDISRKILGRTLFRSMMKNTFFGHFVAGENEVDLKPVIQRNSSYGVKAILDYSVEKDVSEEQAKEKVVEAIEEVFVAPEETLTLSPATPYRPNVEFAQRDKNVTSARTYYYDSEKECDANMEVFMKSIDAVANTTNKAGLTAIKLTALGRPQLLLHFSELLTYMRYLYDALRSDGSAAECSDGVPALGKLDVEHFKFRLDALGLKLEKEEELRWFTILDVTGDGDIDLLDWNHMIDVQVDLARVFQVRTTNQESSGLTPLMSPLTDEGVEELRNMLHRVNQLAQYAKDRDVRIMVDAEQSYLQPAIRRITMEMMRVFNKERAVVFNTYQCYMTAALDHASMDLALAEREDFYFGAKLVRGAYMEQERARAKDMCYADPICKDYEATTAMYHRVMEHVFHCIARRRGKVAVMIASHNEDTVRHAVKLMKQWNVEPADRLICFGQLYGMCDHMSFPMGQAGFSVYKYMPYGPVEEVLPYLSRRALENRGLLEKVLKERGLLWNELKRRLTFRN